MILYKYKIERNKNIFSPNFSFQMAEDTLPVKLENFKIFFINKEKELLNKYSYDSDGDTKLGENSITSRFSKYNLLNFLEMSFLKDIIKQKYFELIKKLNVELDKPAYIQCWFNIMRKGEQIKKHKHTNNKNSGRVMCGNICVNVKNSHTYYEPPLLEDVIKIKNKNNQIVFFPSWLEHYTDEVKSDYERITIGFDIIHHDLPDTGVWIKL